MGMVTSGIGLGIGAQVASESGSPEAASALGKISAAYPKMGTIMAGGMVMDATRSLMPKGKRRRY